MKVILHYIKPFIPRMSVGISIKFIGAVMELLLPWILSYLIDDIVPLRDIGLILLWGGAMVLAAVAALVTNIVANRMAAWVAQHTTQALRHDLFEKISYLSCSHIDSYTIPSLESRLTSDTYNVHQMIGMIQRMGVRAPILLVGGHPHHPHLGPGAHLGAGVHAALFGGAGVLRVQAGHPPVCGFAKGRGHHGAHRAGDHLRHPGD